MPSRQRSALLDRPERAVFGKTKLCKFHILGCCTRGSACLFAHNTEELTTPPDLSCTKFCKSLLNMGFCNDSNCSYAHSRDELRAMPAPPRSQMEQMNLRHNSVGAAHGQGTSQPSIGQSTIQLMAPTFQFIPFSHVSAQSPLQVPVPSPLRVPLLEGAEPRFSPLLPPSTDEFAVEDQHQLL